MTYQFHCAGRRWRGVAVAVAGGAALIAARGHAQVRDTALGTRLVATGRSRAPFHDTLRVTLVRNGAYRIAVWPGAARVTIQPPNGTAPAFAARVREGTRDTATAIEFVALDDGPHAIIVAGPAGSQETRVWIWEDTDTERAARRRRDRRIALGFSVAAGTTSGYEIGEPVAASSSTYVEAGVLIGSNSRFSLYGGVGFDRRSHGVESVNWVFAEPRFRLFDWQLCGRDIQLHIVARYAQGNSTNIISDPSLVASGLMLAWHLDHLRATHGLIASVEPTYGRLGNVTVANQRAARLAFAVSWLP